MKKEFDQEAKQRLYKRLAEILDSEQILFNEEMSAHTTFRTGGKADIFVEIATCEQLGKVLAALRAEGLLHLNKDFFLLGNGSNVLVSDKGIQGVVLHLSKAFSNIAVHGTTLVCEAGATLAQVARKACDCALTGFEFAAGIPGSIGGAIVMNAGAYGGEMQQIVECVRLMTPDGELIEKTGAEMNFAYRHSIVKEQSLIVLGAAFALAHGNPDEIQAKMEDLACRRRKKQPLEYPSAGSTFKRPEGYFAAKLIEDAGLRGFSVGGAQVSEKHCGFIINKDNASAADIQELIAKVQRRVFASAKVTIEPEVILLGFD